MSALDKIKSAISEQGSPAKLNQLNLTSIKFAKFTSEIKKEIQKCSNLEILILTECGLQSLDNMPDCDLTAIDLSQNNLGDSELVKLANYKNLGQLIFNENKVEKVDSIKVLSKLQHLQEVDFSGNPVASTDKYRESVFESLPKLQVLDRLDREGNQVEQQEFQDDGEDDDDEEFDDDGDDDDEDEDFDDEDQEQSPKPKKKR